MLVENSEGLRQFPNYFWPISEFFLERSLGKASPRAKFLERNKNDGPTPHCLCFFDQLIHATFLAPNCFQL